MDIYRLHEEMNEERVIKLPDDAPKKGKVTLVAMVYDEETETEKMQRVNNLLEEFLDNLPGRLSGGESTRQLP